MTDGVIFKHSSLFIKNSDKGNSLGKLGCLDPCLYRTYEQHSDLGVHVPFEIKTDTRPTIQRMATLKQAVSSRPDRKQPLFAYRRAHGTEELFKTQRSSSIFNKQTVSGEDRGRKEVMLWEQIGGFLQTSINGLWASKGE